MKYEPLFDPITNLSDKALKSFAEHYQVEESEARETARKNCYGGVDILKHFKGVSLSPHDGSYLERKADIKILAQKGSIYKDIEIIGISLKQFLVSGYPPNLALPTDGEDYWDQLDPQYRLELCHSEICRWSLILKKGDNLIGGIKVKGHDPFSDIEIVNNCTNTEGFEVKLKPHDEKELHGSFGKDGNLEEAYSALSQVQAGSLAKQNALLKGGVLGLGLRFFGFPIRHSLYDMFAKQREVTLSQSLSWSMDIDLTRYGYTSADAEWQDATVVVDEGKIDYDRWGEGSEYYQKPKVRKLVLSYQDGEQIYKQTPTFFSDIKKAQYISLPNFETTGIYNIDNPQFKIHYGKLYSLKHCQWYQKTDGRYDLELIRDIFNDGWDFRRIIFGNLPLDTISPGNPFTLHRLDVGPRDTIQLYDDDFVPPGESPNLPAFSYILGGEGNIQDSIRYILPESFGLERAIFEVEADFLVITLISFERILPVWRGRIDINGILSPRGPN